MIRHEPIEHTIVGNPEGPTLVFIHGWPDDASLWRRQADELGQSHRCVLLTLPNFGGRADKAGGYDFPELAERLAATIRLVQPRGGIGLVVHDWGSYLGYLLERNEPGLVSSIAALDVGAHIRPENLKTSLMILGYQWALITCWLAGGVIPPLGNLMTRGVSKVIRVPKRQAGAVRSRSNYLYYYLWKRILLPGRDRNLLRSYRPQCPIMFLYGKRKPLMFHSSRWLKTVDESGGYSEGIDGAGHWLMETHAEIVNERLSAWFEDRPGHLGQGSSG